MCPQGGHFVVPQQLLNRAEVRPGEQGTNFERPTLNLELRTGLPAALALSLAGRLDTAHKARPRSTFSVRRSVFDVRTCPFGVERLVLRNLRFAALLPYSQSTALSI